MTIFFKHLGVSLLGFFFGFLLISCNDNGFQGQNAKKEPVSATPVPYAPAPYIPPRTDSPAPFIPGTPSEIPEDEDTPKNKNDLDWAGFNSLKAFHLGDDGMDGSSCKSRIKISRLNQAVVTDMLFPFTVETDYADFLIALYHCGVDYNDLNFANLYNRDTRQYLGETVPLRVINNPLNFLGMMNKQAFGTNRIRLMKGNYAIHVQSLPNTTNRNDVDDYMFKVKLIDPIGKIRLDPFLERFSL